MDERNHDNNRVGMPALSIRRFLLDKKNAVREQIWNYPPPIPACDQQFNYLLEQQDLLSQEIARLDAIIRDRQPADQGASIDDFVSTSKFIDNEAKRKLVGDQSS
ncbi:MAG: hypothetical protein HY342_03795 [Candidatus Lambdaproteobacteria bacterium]|nr:hypothetical protein [Candidatus Lambdaproteobacteria bacterium]